MPVSLPTAPRGILVAWLPLCLLLMGLSLLCLLPTAMAEETPLRMLDQQPFDRITLNTASGDEAIDTLLLELPNRTVPNPFPASGSLELRRLNEPSVLYTVPWSSIERIELFEDLLLAEAATLTRAKNLSEAYEYLDFLYTNYPKLAGLNGATEKYLRQDALASYAKKNYEETLTVLLSLYDLNPQHRGLDKFVITVTDRMIARHLATRDFASARSVLDLLADGFPKLSLSNISIWQSKFEKGAARQLSIGRKALEEERYSDARQALQRALAILPTATGAAEILAEIEQKLPQLVVAVDQLVGPSQQNTLHWATARVSQLTQPKLLSQRGFGAEGGDYHSPWAEIASDDSGLQLDIRLNPQAIREGISAEVVALELLKQADSTLPQYRADFAGLLRDVDIHQGNLVSIHWQRSHVRPEALLSLTLRNVTQAATPPGTYQATFDKSTPELVTFRLPNSESTSDKKQTAGPQALLEKFYENEEVALAELLRGEADVLARVPPWQVARLQQVENVVVAPYRLPSLHVLLLNFKRPIMGRREFRRALCYGINRPQILNDILLGGDRRPGFRVLSAPLPAGITLTDPVGYAYNQGLQPRPYEPRLATVLAAVARNSLSKLAAAKEKSANEGEEPNEKANDEEAAAPPVKPLVLAHSPNPVATTACQSIQLQLNAIGIPVKLLPLDPQMGDTEQGYDLLYAELALWEPLVDARRLLGPHGLAGHCSSSMSLALRDVDQAKNWKEARSRLQEVHQIAMSDLPVIPLWQTVDYFAHRKTLRGIGTTPVTLYQNVTDWQRAAYRGGKP